MAGIAALPEATATAQDVVRAVASKLAEYPPLTKDLCNAVGPAPQPSVHVSVQGKAGDLIHGVSKTLLDAQKNVKDTFRHFIGSIRHF